MGVNQGFWPLEDCKVFRVIKVKMFADSFDILWGARDDRELREALSTRGFCSNEQRTVTETEARRLYAQGVPSQTASSAIYADEFHKNNRPYGIGRPHLHVTQT